MTDENRPPAPERSPEYAERRKARLEDKQAVTGQISETCRYICFGLLALFYSLHTAEEKAAAKFLNQAPVWLTVMAVLAALAIVADYLQYFFGAWAVDRALLSDDQLFGKSWWSYRLRKVCFQSKQYLTIAAAIVILGVMVTYLVHGGASAAAAAPTPP